MPDLSCVLWLKDACDSSSAVQEGEGGSNKNITAQKLEVNWCVSVQCGGLDFVPAEQTTTHPEDRFCFSWSQSTTSKFASKKTK